MSAPALLRSSPRLDPASQDAWARLADLRTPGERQAALLALLLTPDSAPERRAWQDATRAVTRAPQVRDWVVCLPDCARLPALEALLSACAAAPLAERQAMLLGLRRMMCADGLVRPIDRLAWLVVRHRLSGPRRPSRRHQRLPDTLSQLPLALRQAIAHATAYLARLVPGDPPQDAGLRVGAAGTHWHDTVIASVWGPHAEPPRCQVPDNDQLVRAWQTLQALDWMIRPVLARLWTDAAATRPGLLCHADDALPVAAQALWLACALLDTPLPPVLASHFLAEIHPASRTGQEHDAVGT